MLNSQGRRVGITVEVILFNVIFALFCYISKTCTNTFYTVFAASMNALLEEENHSQSQPRVLSCVMQWMQLFLPCNEMPASSPRPLHGSELAYLSCL